MRQYASRRSEQEMRVFLYGGLSVRWENVKVHEKYSNKASNQKDEVIHAKVLL